MPTNKVSAARCILRYTLSLQTKHFGTQCAICLELLYSGLSDGVMLACRHLFHLSCMTRYALSESRDCGRMCMLRCPICRAVSATPCHHGVLFPRWIIRRWKVGPLVQQKPTHPWLWCMIRSLQRQTAAQPAVCNANSSRQTAALLRARALAQAIEATVQHTHGLRFRVHSKAYASAVDDEHRWSRWWDLSHMDNIGAYSVIRHLRHGLLNNHCCVLVRVGTVMQSVFKRQLRSMQHLLRSYGIHCRLLLRSTAVFTYSNKGKLQRAHFTCVGSGEPCCLEFSLVIPSDQNRTAETKAALV